MHDDSRPSLDIDAGRDGTPLVTCRACGAGLLAVLDALGLRGSCGGSTAPATRLRPTARATRAPSADDAQRTAHALALWRTARPAIGSPVGTYLRSRGLTLVTPERLRYAPELRHAPSSSSWPAMLALVTRGRDDESLAVHRTYLARDGAGKAPIEPQRMMLGPCAGGAVRLAQHDPERELVLGEGIETALSVAHATGLPAWAALSTSGLLALDLPAEVREVLIVADGDDAGEGAARDSARRWIREGRRVRIAMPPRGSDANDLLRGSTGAGGES